MLKWILISAGITIFIMGIRIIRPTERGLIERLGRYQRFGNFGFNWIFPFIEGMVYVNITEQMADVQPQDIITKDNLNARVDLVVYYKVKQDEENVKRSVYNVEDFERQIISLAQTTARNVIGDMKFTEVNSQRNVLNASLATALDKESDAWGVQIVRVELKEITPPNDVQETMNRIIKAQNEKEAAIDFATAQETKADGEKRASIKRAEGERQATILAAEAFRQQQILKAEGKKQEKILEADGEKEAIEKVAHAKAEAIKLVNNSANEHFKGNAQLLKQQEVTQAALEHNSKIIFTKEGINPQIILGQIPTTNDKTE